MKPLIVANWKMNLTSLVEARRIFYSIKQGSKNVKGVKVVICPPFQYLSFIKSGAQNLFYEERGAYTGEISPLMLKDMGVKYVIVGHSERRKYFRETDEMINKKLKAALKTGLKPILCVDKISQIKKYLKGISKKELKNLVLAYEPLFAIGTGKPCSIERARKMNFSIKKILGKRMLVLYGGSVNSQNARGFIKEAGFHGLLVGGVSLRPKEFVDIIKRVC